MSKYNKGNAFYHNELGKVTIAKRFNKNCVMVQSGMARFLVAKVELKPIQREYAILGDA